MRKGITWIKKNPRKKSNIVLSWAPAAIIPIKEDTGVTIPFNPKPLIINDKFLVLIFGNPAVQNKTIEIAIITNIST